MIFTIIKVFPVERDIKDRSKCFALKNIQESLGTAFKARPDNGRVYVILLIINFSIFMFCLNSNHFDFLLVLNK